MANISNTSKQKQLAVADIQGLQNVLDQITANGVQLVDNLTSDDADKALAAKQGKALKTLIDAVSGKVTALETLVQSDDTDLDTIQEIVTKIKAVDNVLGGVSAVMDTKKAEAIQAAKDALDTKAAQLQAAIDAKVAKADIVDNLTDGGADKVLSAEQGKALKTLVDSKTSVTVKDALDSDSTTEALSAKQGKELKTALDTVSEKVNLIETVTKYFEVEFNGEKEKEASNAFFKVNSVVDYTFLNGDTAGRILTYVEDGKVTIKSDENETGKFAIYVTSRT